MNSFDYIPISFLLTFLFFNSVSAQPTIDWSKNFGSEHQDWVRSIQQTTDEGYIVAGVNCLPIGHTGNNGLHDYWVAKLDDKGNLEWENTYGGSGWEFAYSIRQTVDGGYIVAGRAGSENGDVGPTLGSQDYWIVKLDRVGNIEWEKNYGGTGNQFALSIQLTRDSGYIVAGSTDSDDGDVGGNNGSFDYWILKLDSYGELVWEKNYGGSLYDEASSVEQTSDGGYIVAGTSDSNDGDLSSNFGENDIWIVKLSENGNLEWERSYGGSMDERASTIEQTTDGGYIVAGRSESNDGDVGGNFGAFDYWILKLDNTGELEWEKNLGGSSDDRAFSIQQTTDEGFIISGDSGSSDGDVGDNYGSGDCWIVKLDSRGDIEWEENYGGSNYEVANTIQQTADGGYIIGAHTQSDDGDLTQNLGETDFWIIKLKPISTAIQTTEDKGEFTISPNPAKGEIIVLSKQLNHPFKIEVFDAIGRSVYTKNNIYDRQMITNISRGIYYVLVSIGNNVYSEKLIVH